MMVTEELLEELGVDLAGGSAREIRARCPVHHLVKGRPDAKPSWYMNRTTGAWICFSCNQGGSLGYLISLLGGDQEMLISAMDSAAVRTMEEIRAQAEDSEPDPEPEKKIFISEYGFRKNPVPPKLFRLRRDIKKVDCESFNLRWDIEWKVFLIPLYDLADNMLIGWQEKAKGYFKNVPTEVRKSDCLFGFQQYMRGDLFVVESPLDVVRLAQYGMSAVATMGSYVSSRQIEAIADVVPERSRIVLAFDNDEAGNNAKDFVWSRLASNAMATVVGFRYFDGVTGKDPGELPIEAVIRGAEEAQVWRPVHAAKARRR